jgi:MFS family permease
MVASMFVTVAIVYGLSFDIIGLFYNSLAKEFGVSRAKFSLLATSFSLSFLIGGLVAGWMLDRIGAQFVVVGGAIVVIAGLLVASAASGSFDALAGALSNMFDFGGRGAKRLFLNPNTGAPVKSPH